ncbi:hypothetical protein D3C72_1927230 [compost metagenome]
MASAVTPSRIDRSSLANSISTGKERVALSATDEMNVTLPSTLAPVTVVMTASSPSLASPIRDSGTWPRNTMGLS